MARSHQQEIKLKMKRFAHESLLSVETIPERLRRSLKSKTGCKTCQASRDVPASETDGSSKTKIFVATNGEKKIKT